MEFGFALSFPDRSELGVAFPAVSFEPLTKWFGIDVGCNEFNGGRRPVLFD